MTTLQQAAQELLDRWDSTYWKDQRATSEYVNALREALEAEQAQAVEPATGERAELIHWLRERSMWDGMLRLIDAANMLEADATLADDLTIAYMAGVEAGRKQAQQVAVPAGMALVPIEPTPAILDAMSSSGWKTACYKAMLAAAQGREV